jgi:hypothetical protein
MSGHRCEGTVGMLLLGHMTSLGHDQPSFQRDRAESGGEINGPQRIEWRLPLIHQFTSDRHSRLCNTHSCRHTMPPSTPTITYYPPQGSTDETLCNLSASQGSQITLTRQGNNPHFVTLKQRAPVSKIKSSYGFEGRSYLDFRCDFMPELTAAPNSGGSQRRLNSVTFELGAFVPIAKVLDGKTGGVELWPSGNDGGYAKSVKNLGIFEAKVTGGTYSAKDDIGPIPDFAAEYERPVQVLVRYRIAGGYIRSSDAASYTGGGTEPSQNSTVNRGRGETWETTQAEADQLRLQSMLGETQPGDMVSQLDLEDMVSKLVDE